MTTIIVITPPPPPPPKGGEPPRPDGFQSVGADAVNGLVGKLEADMASASRRDATIAHALLDDAIRDGARVRIIEG